MRAVQQALTREGFDAKVKKMPLSVVIGALDDADVGVSYRGFTSIKALREWIFHRSARPIDGIVFARQIDVRFKDLEIKRARGETKKCISRKVLRNRRREALMALVEQGMSYLDAVEKVDGLDD